MATWHYLENQFLTVTTGRRGLADAIYKDHQQKLTLAAATAPALAPLLVAMNTAAGPWAEKYGAWKNAKAGYRGASQALLNLLEVLRVKPVGGGRSRIEEWDSKIRAHWSPGDPIYDGLLPRGREAFTTGALDAIVDEVARLAERLEEQAGELEEAAAAATGEAATLLTEQANDLTALQAKVATFAGQLNTARNTQTQKEGLVDQLSQQLEPARVTLCTALYRNAGSLIALFAPNQNEVAGFYDLALIMSPPAGEDDEEPGGNPPVG